MLVPLLISLGVAAVAIFLSFNATEEMVKIASVFVAGVCLLISLVAAPIVLKLLIVAFPLLSKTFQFAE